MPSREGSNLRPWWRFRHALNKQKVTHGTPLPPKDVKNEGRSGYVYENKLLHDKMPDEIARIYLEMTRTMQNIAGMQGRLAISRVFQACLEVELSDSVIWRLGDWSSIPASLLRRKCQVNRKS